MKDMLNKLTILTLVATIATQAFAFPSKLSSAIKAMERKPTAQMTQLQTRGLGNSIIWGTLGMGVTAAGLYCLHNRYAAHPTYKAAQQKINFGLNTFGWGLKWTGIIGTGAGVLGVGILTKSIEETPVTDRSVEFIPWIGSRVIALAGIPAVLAVGGTTTAIGFGIEQATATKAILPKE